MRITFTINETKYSLDLDGNQYSLVRHGINTKDGENLGKPTETQLGYYSQIKNGLNRAVQTELGSSIEEIDLKEFLLRYESAMESISNQIGDK
jgi:hypothetical protein